MCKVISSHKHKRVKVLSQFRSKFRVRFIKQEKTRTLIRALSSQQVTRAIKVPFNNRVITNIRAPSTLVHHNMDHLNTMYQPLKTRVLARSKSKLILPRPKTISKSFNLNSMEALPMEVPLMGVLRMVALLSSRTMAVHSTVLLRSSDQTKISIQRKILSSAQPIMGPLMCKVQPSIAQVYHQISS